jgi:hypothetical protein
VVCTVNVMFGVVSGRFFLMWTCFLSSFIKLAVTQLGLQQNSAGSIMHTRMGDAKGKKTKNWIQSQLISTHSWPRSVTLRPSSTRLCQYWALFALYVVCSVVTRLNYRYHFIFRPSCSSVEINENHLH